MNKFNRHFYGLLLFCLTALSSCQKNETTNPATNAIEVKTFTNQTGDPAAEALQVRLADNDKKYSVNVYGTFDASNNPSVVRSLTYQKMGNDTTVHLLINNLTQQLETIYLDVRGTKLPLVIKHGYLPGDNDAVRISLYSYDWSNNTSVLRNETLFRRSAGASAQTPVFVAQRGAATTDLIGSIGGVAVGFGVAELVFYTQYSSGLLATYGPAVVAAVGTAAPLITTTAAVLAVGVALKYLVSTAGAATLNPSNSPYPTGTPPTHLTTLPAPASLPASPCNGSNISFRASMDGQGNIAFSAVTGATQPYSYAVNGQNFQASPVFANGYADGSFLVLVRSATGCVGAQVVSLSRNNISTMTWTVDTTTVTAAQVTAGNVASNGVAVLGTAGSAYVRLAMPKITGPQSVNTGPTGQANMVYTTPTGVQYVAGTDRGYGTITISSLTATRAIGSFSCTVIPASGPVSSAGPGKQISGTFDVTL